MRGYRIRSGLRRAYAVSTGSRRNPDSAATATHPAARVSGPVPLGRGDGKAFRQSADYPQAMGRAFIRRVGQGMPVGICEVDDVHGRYPLGLKGNMVVEDIRAYARLEGFKPQQRGPGPDFPYQFGALLEGILLHRQGEILDPDHIEKKRVLDVLGGKVIGEVAGSQEIFL